MYLLEGIQELVRVVPIVWRRLFHHIPSLQFLSTGHTVFQKCGTAMPEVVDFGKILRNRAK